LVAWTPERARDNCREKTPDDAWGTCGPLYADVGALRPTPNGLRRFYVEAGYGTIAGATVGQQFSIWTWDGRAAKPILVHDYARMVEQAGARIEGNIIRIPAKGSLKQLFACGACVGREMQVVIRLDTPKGAELVGERSLTPELDLIDGLYDRVLNDKSATALATPEVIDRVRAELKDAKPDDLPLGMIDSWTHSGSAGRRTLCLASEGDAGSHLFTFARDQRGLRIVDVQPTTSQCDGPGARN